MNKPIGLALTLTLMFASSLTGHAQIATKTDVPAPLSYQGDWRWVKGAVFVPTKYVNEAQQWDQ